MSVKRKIKRRRKPVEKKKIDLDMNQLEDLLKRAEEGKLEQNDVELIKAMAECIVFLSQTVDEKATTVKRLLRMVFGAKTEKKDTILNETAEKNGDNDQGVENQDSSGQDSNGDKKEKKKNHIAEMEQMLTQGPNV